MVAINDTSWLHEKEAGGVITKALRYVVIVDGVPTTKEVKADILILPGTQYARYQDALLNRGEDGEFHIDSNRATVELVRMSTGMTQQDIDLLRTHKPMSLWQALINACQEVNALTPERIEEEKN